MRIIAICSDDITHIGLKLVGIDCHHAATEAEITAVLSTLPVAETGILVISENLAKYDSLAKFTDENPQILVHFLQI